MKKLVLICIVSGLIFPLLLSGISSADTPSIQYHTVIEYQPFDTGNTKVNKELLKKGCPEFFDVKWDYSINDIKSVLDGIGLNYKLNQYKDYRCISSGNSHNEPLIIVNGLHITFFWCSFTDIGTEENVEWISFNVKESPTEVAKILEGRYGESELEFGNMSEAAKAAVEYYELWFYDGDNLITVNVHDYDEGAMIDYKYHRY